MLTLLLTLTLIANPEINSQLPVTTEMAHYRTCFVSKQMTQTQINEIMQLDRYDCSTGFFTTGLENELHYTTYMSKDGSHRVTVKLNGSPNGFILDTVEVD
jgi:hypothetical protein